MKLVKRVAVLLSFILLFNMSGQVYSATRSINDVREIRLKERSEFEQFQIEVIRITKAIEEKSASDDSIGIEQLVKELQGSIDTYSEKIKDEVKSLKRTFWWRGFSAEKSAGLNDYEVVLNKVEKLSKDLSDICNDGIKKDEFNSIKTIVKEATTVEKTIDKSFTETLPNEQIKYEMEKFNSELIEDKIETYSLEDISVKSNDVNQYLGETKEIKFTEDLINKSKEIGSSPLDIFNYVRNNVMFEPYSGSRKGSIGTLDLLSGNDYDQASLLIALLRYNKIPARYVSGEIQLNINELMNWVGAEDKQSALDIISSMGNKVRVVIDKGEVTGILLKHIWVEAYLPVNEYRGLGLKSDKSQWIPLDPSFKRTKKVEQIDIPREFGFDVNELYNITKNHNTDSNGNITYANFDGVDKLIEDFKNNANNPDKLKEFEDKRVVDVIGGYEIIKEELSLLPYGINNNVLNINNRLNEIPSAEREKVTLSLSDGLFSDLYYSADAVDLYGKKITISWIPETKDDKEIVNKYGNILDTPINLIYVKPVIMVEGIQVAEGDSTTVGQEYSFNTTIQRVGLSGAKANNILTAGGIYALGLDFGSISKNEIERSKKAIENFGTFQVSKNYYSDEIAGELLNGIIKSYFLQTDSYNRILESQYNVANSRLLSFGLVALQPDVKYLFGRPYSADLGSIYVDVDLSTRATVSRNSDKAKEDSYVKQTGAISSMIEHSILEQLTGLPSVSTTKIMSEAARQGITIYNINSQNIDEILPKLEVDTFIKDDIKNSVSLGRTITIPAENIDFYDWNGIGYVVQDEATGSTGYMISGGHSGGSGGIWLGPFNILDILQSFIYSFLESIIFTLALSLISFVFGPIVAT
ncbi:MAG: transglutaminase-like domain-containing protein, partial [Clostridium sp.]